jgi:hypothetical protein
MLAHSGSADEGLSKSASPNGSDSDNVRVPRAAVEALCPAVLGAEIAKNFPDRAI